MKGQPKPFELAAVLSRLKDFQRQTVDHVFDRLYGDDSPTHRFLVADEVGLGKTLVARGLIARAIDHLWEEVDRLDIVYICSNSAIARQNVSRLNPTREEDFNLATRITLLPLQLSDIKHRPLNFVSFTPGTSFDLKSALGTVRERALIYHVLKEYWDLPKTAERVLQGSADIKTFRSAVAQIAKEVVDEDLADAFRTSASQNAKLKSELLALCETFSPKSASKDDRRNRALLVGGLRQALATTCLHALQPDMIIVDEFQRFKHLLDGEDEASRLARDLFSYQDDAGRSAKVVLLSATPYKMYTMAHEAAEDDHYQDFLRTVRFLEAGQATKSNDDLESLIKAYRGELLAYGDGAGSRLPECAQAIEQRLRRVIVRTERLAVTADRNGMLHSVDGPPLQTKVSDLRNYVGLQRVAKLVEQGDPLEYWRSAPYVLNFMEEYKLKESVRQRLTKSSEGVPLTDLLRQHKDLLVSWDEIEKYQRIDPANGRLRALEREVLDTDSWKALWLPPTLPYYQLGHPFDALQKKGMTKRLIFSSWKVVPKVVATLLSYDAERRMFRLLDDAAINTAEERKKRRGLLRFSRTEGRLTGMPVLGMIYPSAKLATFFDPLHSAHDPNLPTSDALITSLTDQIQELLKSVPHDPSRSEDEAWYWAAPILLDKATPGGNLEVTRAWFNQPRLEDVWSGEATKEVEAASAESGDDDLRSGWADHVEAAHERFVGGGTLGAPPADLPRMLAQLALAGPGVVALRALTRVCRPADSSGWTTAEALALRNAAASMAYSMVPLFNVPEVTALVRGLSRDKEQPHWRRVLEYMVDGCYQAVIDEYLHLLVELLGLIDKPAAEVAQELKQWFSDVMQLRAANLGVHEIAVGDSGESSRMNDRTMRCRFALRYSEDRSEDSGDRTRTDQVAAAFNSPFWPFVLATTSVGQEGLDFHPYCHAVVHWNLPANPVDLEQREGRVHRYKGHAVRKNVARAHRHHVNGNSRDPWEIMFAAAKAEQKGKTSDLVPFWVYTVEGGAQIERHVPMTPLSRDVQKLHDLRQALALYRMVFGQSRQDELAEYLLRIPQADRDRLMEELRIDLSPRSTETHAQPA